MQISTQATVRVSVPLSANVVGYSLENYLERVLAEALSKSKPGALIVLDFSQDSAIGELEPSFAETVGHVLGEVLSWESHWQLAVFTQNRSLVFAIRNALLDEFRERDADYIELFWVRAEEEVQDLERTLSLLEKPEPPPADGRDRKLLVALMQVQLALGLIRAVLIGLAFWIICFRQANASLGNFALGVLLTVLLLQVVKFLLLSCFARLHGIPPQELIHAWFNAEAVRYALKPKVVHRQRQRVSSAVSDRYGVFRLQ